MNNKYDVIVIGGGHNGLVNAAYLARAGKRVLVLERRYVLGGAAVTEEVFPGFKFSVCSYVVSLLRPEIIRELDLPRHGLEILASCRRDPGDRRGAVERLRAVAAVHDVAVDLGVFFGRADVYPVAAVDVGDEGLTPFDERRKKAALDRPGRVRGDAVERIGLEDVDAGVDRVAGDLVGSRSSRGTSGRCRPASVSTSPYADGFRPASARWSPWPCVRGAGRSRRPDRPG